MGNGFPDNAGKTMVTKRDAPAKACPQCWLIVHNGQRYCPECGHEFYTRKKPARVDNGTEGALDMG